jgi:hypothetical protein
MLSFLGTNYGLKAVPGAVNEGTFTFAKPGEFKIPCHEFCGAGHYAMRGQLHVVQGNSLPPCFLAKGGLVSHANRAWRLRIGSLWLGVLGILFATILLSSGRGSSAQSENAEPSVRIPSNVAWTENTLAVISSGDAFRGLLLA